MAFNFLGTLSLEQLRELRSFLQAETEEIEEQINNLRVELDNTKRTREEFRIADVNFGGSIQTPEGIVTKYLFENELPDVFRIIQQDDTNSAKLIEKVKKPFIQNIKFKRERIEHKVKKLTDLIEQIREMIDRKAIAKTQTDQLLNEVERLFTAENSNHLFQTTEQLKNFQQGLT